MACDATPTLSIIVGCMQPSTSPFETNAVHVLVAPYAFTCGCVIYDALLWVAFAYLNVNDCNWRVPLEKHFTPLPSL